MGNSSIYLLEALFLLKQRVQEPNVLNVCLTFHAMIEGKFSAFFLNQAGDGVFFLVL